MRVIRLNKKIFSRLLITRWTRRKCIVIFFVIFLCFLSSFYTIILVRSSTILSTHKSNLSYVVVHLDFKRTPLKLDYLKRLLYELKNHGATALLLEYEDMFPYEGELISLRSKHYYTKKELKQFLEHSNALGLEIIPLIQTFGHLEFVLKHNKFRHLRENFAYIDSLCPSKKESRRLIKNLLFQVIEFHKSITPLKHFHVGCDEVYNMNSCKNCVERNLTKLEIYLDHIQTVTNMVKDFSPGTTVLIWDDMLRTVSLTNWNVNANIPVELVYWNYEKSFQVSHVNLMKYHKTFPNIWIATAYKGADGIESVLPNVEKRFLNHFTWLQEIYDYTFGGEKEVFNFKGIILTGWSRYFHLAPSCDLFPASIPSLILNLLLVKDFITGDFTSAVKTKWFFKLNDPSGYFHEYLNHKLEKSLQCESVEVSFSNFNNKLVDFDNLLLSNCNFEEWKFYEHLKQYLELNSNVVTSHKVSKYIQRNKVINGENESSWCKDVSNQVIEINASLTNTMNKYYETDFIVEYVSDKISYLTKTIVKSCGILYNT